MFTNLKRIAQFGWRGFTRNKGLSIGVIFIMTFAVSVLTSLYLSREVSSFLISQAQKKVDIAVYFKKDTKESTILQVRDKLHKFGSGIESVNYISDVQAKNLFLQKHKGDSLYLQALKEVGGNPFLPSLNVKAKNPSLYAQISSFLTTGSFKNSIARVSYYQNEKVIKKLFGLSRNIKTIGIGLSLLLILLTIFITFSTIKLTILAFRKEISTMRLVGATNWFIRGPFIIQSCLYAFFAVLVTDFIFLAFLMYLNPKLQSWFFDLNILKYFESNFFFLLFAQLVFGLTLSIGSSLIAVRKYLKI